VVTKGGDKKRLKRAGELLVKGIILYMQKNKIVIKNNKKERRK